LSNNRLLIDGIFIRDYHADDSTVFASGGNKNGMSPALWSTPTSQGVPDKNDILDVFMHVRREGPSGTDSLWHIWRGFNREHKWKQVFRF
jgi:hypothetical protein